MLKRFQSPIYCVWGNLNKRVVFTSTPALVAQRIEHLTTDQKVRGSNPFKRTKQNSRSEKCLLLINAFGFSQNLSSVSYLVSNGFPKFLKDSQPPWRVWFIFNGGICPTIVYQHEYKCFMLILDKSSQDLILRGYSLGTQISVFSSRGFLSTFDVSLKSKSTPKSKQNSLFKRGRNASHTCDCNRSIHKTNIQRNNDWRF